MKSVNQVAPLLAAIIVLLTVFRIWVPQFLSLDLHRVRERMRGRLLVDGRNLFDPERVRAAGLEYVGVGRRSSAADLLLSV